MNAGRPHEGGADRGDGGGSPSPTGLSHESIGIDGMIKAFNAEIVEKSPGDELRFWKAWNAAQPHVEIPIKNRAVGRPYHPKRPTSQGAAISATTAPEMRRRVLEVIRTRGPVCDDEIAVVLGVDSNSIRPRRLELLRLGAIREDDRRRRTRSGRSAIGWRA